MPCPSWPNTQASGRGSAVSCSHCASRRCVPTTGRPSAATSAIAAPSTSVSAKCAPMPARSTLGDHSATLPLSATTCAKPIADARAQDAADVAGILQAVEDDGVAARLRRGGGVGLDQEADRRRRLQAAQLAHQRIGNAHDLGRVARERLERGVAQPDSVTIARSGARAALEQRAAQVVAFQPDAAQLAVGRRLGEQLAQVLEQVVVARRDLADDGHALARRRRGAARPRAPARTSGGARRRGRARRARPGAPRCRSPCAWRSRTAGSAARARRRGGRA